MRILVEHEELYHGFRGFRSRKVGGQTYIQLFLDFAPKSHMDGVVDAMLTLKSALESEIPDSEVNVIPGVHTAL